MIVEVFILKIGWVEELLLDFCRIVFVERTSWPEFISIFFSPSPSRFYLTFSKDQIIISFSSSDFTLMGFPLKES